MQIRRHICPLCEAGCGLLSEVDTDDVVSTRGNPDHVSSRGHICPKALALRELHADPDRVRTPLIRSADGRLEPVSWDEAFAAIDARLTAVLDRYGPDSVALYLGNPVAHDFATTLYSSATMRALGSRNIYSANTVDAMPKFVACQLMFGGMYTVPLPDLDRCSYVLILGANPLVSNGSLLTAPGMRARLRALQRRGGRLIVVDPNRSQTAREADEHYPIRPGADALLLLALVHALFSENSVNLGRLGPHVRGLETIEELARDFSPEVVAPHCDIPAADIRRLARELAAAPTAAVYGRTGTCTQRFGTVTSWLIEVLNVLTGNLDRPGGAMFARPAADLRAMTAQRGVAFGRWHSRVRSAPETLGELPLACLAEEIDTPGDGQVKALITVAGNPARSAPNSARLTAAFGQLELMISMDLYRNETTRHAHVLLPAPSPLTKPHYDLFFHHFAIRNTATYAPPVLPPAPDVRPEWQILLRLIGTVTRQGATADLAAIDDLVAESLARTLGADSQAGGLRGPERLLDLLLRAGPYGDTEPLTLARVRAHPDGVDFGPLRPQLPGLLNTPSGQIELAPQPLVDDIAELRIRLLSPPRDTMVLIGRRHLRSNNSWMHNLPTLAKGPERCTLLVNPADAARLRLGTRARVASHAGVVDAAVEVTDAVRPGVVSLPHGWGHDEPDMNLGIAARRPGVNSNVLADGIELDPLSGTAVLNGIPVQLAASPEESSL
ncbi:molybdopterin-dependent oxidoreductase [Mycolicibacter kumamotonensis]|uniref:Molybdopterin-binding oxidoreductase n=1 Tax=Mycolicibacter kumamotonensis TaxID=354243 RepID=A0A1B8SGR7_9MYCO|nr:molybdopterin-dependent oxidoreductase [Mycolicibacter kumamotonensis]OBY31941.1 molybdopterin-binding oxidoreductase [Mycolicibacter kumamotonensis]